MTTDDLEKELKKIDERLYVRKNDDMIGIYYEDSKDPFPWNVYHLGHFYDDLPSSVEDIKDQISDVINKYRASDSSNNIKHDNPFKSYTDHLAKVLQQKNIAYGDSFTKSVNDYGLSVIGIRLSDKYNRIHHLITNNEMKENDESLKDTLLDMAGYSILALKYLNNIKITKFYGNGKVKDVTVRNLNKEKGNE